MYKFHILKKLYLYVDPLVVVLFLLFLFVMSFQTKVNGKQLGRKGGKRYVEKGLGVRW